jgi:hypothetical protein
LKVVGADRPPLARQQRTNIAAVFDGAIIEREARDVENQIPETRLMLGNALALQAPNHNSAHTGEHR